MFHHSKRYFFVSEKVWKIELHVFIISEGVYIELILLVAKGKLSIVICNPFFFTPHVNHGF